MHPLAPLCACAARMSNWGCTLAQYLVLVPRMPCRIFLLLPSNMTEPEWLRDLFSKLRDPNMREVHIRCKWGMHLAAKLVYILSGKYENVKRQTIRVFRSHKVGRGMGVQYRSHKVGRGTGVQVPSP